MTMYYTGMRVGELCVLTPEDVNLENNTITINKTFQRINGREDVYKRQQAPTSAFAKHVFPVPFFPKI